MEKPTASESGRNMALAAPTMNNAGVNIARMQSIANKRGPAVSVVASNAARPSDLPRARWTWMFSIETVASSTRMPTARARPPKVIILTVCLVIHSASTALINERGMLITTMNALRQSRRKSRIINPVSIAPRAPSRVNPPIARVT